MGNAPCFEGAKALTNGPQGHSHDSSILSFELNGKKLELTNFDARQTLLEYLRDTAKLTGTKRSCLQGGCGACVVVIERYDFVAEKWLVKPLNACLKPLVACDGARITTVEGVGSERRGVHPVQERIAGNHGMQCGYCTPGFVMSTYALLRENGKPSAQQVMQSFDGNICRCTGYRNLVNAGESFAKDAATTCQALASQFTPCDADQEKLKQGPAPPKPQSKVFKTADFIWYAPTSLTEVLQLKKQHKKAVFLLGDTAKGIRGASYEVYGGKAQEVIYLGGVIDLWKEEESLGQLTFGAARRIQDIINALNAREDSTGYTRHLVEAFETPAQRHIRSDAGWAGNLWITRTGFPSDLFPALLAADASVSFVSADSHGEKTVPLDALLPGGKGGPPADALLTKLHIPLPEELENTTYRYYRVAHRKWLAHGMVNAAFRATVDEHSKKVTSARICLGVYGQGPKRAKKCEAALVGKELNTETLKAATAAIHSELDAEFCRESQYNTVDNPNGKDDYRKYLPDAFLFKFVQEVQAQHGIKAWKPTELGHFGVGPAETLKRGELLFQEHAGRENRPQMQAKGLATGEVHYTDDVPISSLYGYMVLSDCATGKLKNIDASKALESEGVQAVITAKDLPKGSTNSCDFVPGEFPIFVPEGGDIISTGMQLALVVATSYRLAKKAAALVTVVVDDKNVGALINLEAAIGAESKLGELLGCPTTEYSQGNVEEALKKSEQVIEGQTHFIGQHAFPMEKQSALAVPEDQRTMVVYSSTQAADLCRHTVAGALGMEDRGAHVVIKQNRAGGGFGPKNSRNIPVACAAAIAANALERPVRIQYEACQEHAAVGGRHPGTAKYQVGFTSEGKIQACNIESWLLSGCTHDFTGMLVIEYSEALASVYNWGGNFKVASHTMKTNTPSHTAVRSFGNPQAMFVTETIVEDVAAAVGKTVEEVRELNMMHKGEAVCPWGQPIEDYNADMIWSKLKADCKFEERQKAVEAFNSEHRWRKRGISLVPMIYGHSYVYPTGTGCLVNIQGGWLGSGRGAVTVHHGGCEIGQGIHTKVAQVVAMTLGCPLEKIRVGDTSTEIVPNQRFTGGSCTSETACEAARRACLELNRRMEPFREALKKREGRDPTWEELCGEANHFLGHDENLSASGTYTPKNNKYAKTLDGAPVSEYHGDYFTCGAGCSEVEIDVLTGERKVLRSDVLYDVGNSMNPGIDLGQVEGSFAYAIGYYLTEEPLHDPKTGADRGQGVWEYKPPMASEMPIEFKAELLRDNPYVKGILGSKAVGEPPFMLAYSVLGAVKKAVAAARKDAGASSKFELPMPCTVDAVQRACATNASHFAC